jgi:hypothetical protein
MKYWFVFLALLCSTFTFAQTRLVGDRLNKLLIHHPYPCQPEFQTFAKDISAGKVPLKMLYLKVQIIEDSLEVMGRVADYTFEGMSANLYCAQISDSDCVLEYKIEGADINGNFSFKLKKDPKHSLYFTSSGHQDLEIKLSELIKVLNQY